jgi:uncharacterized membrane protein
MNTKTTIQAAIAGLVTVGFAVTAVAGPATQPAGTEKCAGVSKAGKNDCGTDKHACAGLAKADKDPAEWNYVAKGTCEKAGGKVVAAAPAKK